MDAVNVDVHASLPLARHAGHLEATLHPFVRPDAHSFYTNVQSAPAVNSFGKSVHTLATHALLGYPIAAVILDAWVR